MRTWSAERLIAELVNRCAVAAQGLIEAVDALCSPPPVPRKEGGESPPLGQPGGEPARDVAIPPEPPWPA